MSREADAALLLQAENLEREGAEVRLFGEGGAVSLATLRRATGVFVSWSAARGYRRRGAESVPPPEALGPVELDRLGACWFREDSAAVLTEAGHRFALAWFAEDGPFAALLPRLEGVSCEELVRLTVQALEARAAPAP